MTIRLLALALGIVNHGLFAAAIASMAISLWTGLAAGRGTLHGTAAVVANLGLLLQFPVVHSLLLTQRGGRMLGSLFPAPYGRALVSTTYATIASLQLLLAFWAWSPSGTVYWQPVGLALGVHALLFAGAWAYLILAILDGGIGVQTGLIGWWSVFRGRPPRYPPFAQHGTFAASRQPIYLAFALVLWTAPTWTPDRLALASLWTAYCVLGPLHKERRLRARHGDAYRSYQERIPYFLPTLRNRS